MRALLRGRALYVFLALTTPLIYFWTLRQHHASPSPIPPASAAASGSGVTSLPALARALEQQPVLAMALAASSLVLVLMVLGGFIIGGYAILKGRWRRFLQWPRRLDTAWSLHDLWRILTLIASFVFLTPAFQIAAHKMPLTAERLHAWLLTSTLFLDSFVILVVLAFARTLPSPGGNVFRLNALAPNAAAGKRSLRAALAVYLAGFPWIFGALFLAAQIAQALGYEPPALPIQRLIFDEKRLIAQAALFFLACVFGPVVEEVLFRGVIYSSFRRHLPAAAAMLLSGFLFAAVHGQWIGLLPITLFGALLALVYEYTGSLTAVIAVHAFHNSVLLLNAVLLKNITALGSTPK